MTRHIVVVAVVAALAGFAAGAIYVAGEWWKTLGQQQPGRAS